MEILINAATSGKEVTVVLELLARFDEEANINWAQRLEDVGAHVVHGVVGHKTHAKMLMVVRREEDGLRRYVHLSTGNYHTRTVSLYTDFGLLTANEEICADVNDVFTQLTGLGRATKLKHLWLAPFSLHKQILRAIQNETQHARDGRKGRIIAKMNALVEEEVIAALHDASQAGVEIDVVEHRATDQGGWDALRDMVAMNLNWDGYGADKKTEQRVTALPDGSPVQGEWHRYGVLWTATGYTFYVDDAPLWRVAGPVSNTPQDLRLTCEVADGSWAGYVPKGGYGTRTTSTARMEVDWVRAFQPPP